MIYKQLSENMRDGLKNIYQQISTVSAENAGRRVQADELFNEASSQLGEVVKATETAAMNIMEIVETHLDLAMEAGEIIKKLGVKLGDDPELTRLAEINEKLQNDLTTVMTSLSFQDITGQRIKKVVSVLNAIEKSVVELYLSSGLMMNAAEKDPNVDVQTAQADAQKAMEEFTRKSASELKGPDSQVTQSSIDDMLSQLGL